MTSFSLLLLSALTLVSASEDTIHQCTEHGQRSYSDRPCPAEAGDTPFKPMAGAGKPASNELTRLKNHQQQQLQERQEQRQQRHLAKEQQQQIKQQQQHLYKCQRLRFKHELAQQQLKRVRANRRNRVILQAKQAQEQYQLHCLTPKE